MRSVGGSPRNDCSHRASTHTAWSCHCYQCAVVGTQRYQIDPAAIEGATHNVGVWAPIVHVALFALGTVLFAPGALVGLAGGMLFGPVWGTVLNLAGATVGLQRRSWSHAIWRTGCGGKQVVGWTSSSRGLRRSAGVSSRPTGADPPVQSPELRARPRAGPGCRLCAGLFRLYAPRHTCLHLSRLGRPGSLVGRGDADTESPCGSGPIGSGGFSAAANPSVARRQTT
jgi:hypothetical protein